MKKRWKGWSLMDNTNRIIMLGGIGKPNWKGNDRKTWMQGYRVYDSEGIAITISAKGGGYRKLCRTLCSQQNPTQP